MTNLVMNFIQYNYRLEYFNLNDLFAKLGGISASVSLGVGSIGFIFIIQYVAQLSGIIHRKEKENLRLFKIKRMTRYVPLII